MDKSDKNGCIKHLRYLSTRLLGNSELVRLAPEDRYILAALCYQEMLRRKLNLSQKHVILKEEGVNLDILESIELEVPKKRKRTNLDKF